MPYSTIALNVFAGSNPNRTRSINQARALNMYLEPTTTGAYPGVYLPWPGAKTWSDGAGTGTARGFRAASWGTLYKVIDTSLYSIASDGTETLIGTIAGTGSVVMDDDGTNLLIAASNNGYVITGSSIAVMSGLYSAGGSVTVLNNQAIWQDQNQGFRIADAGTPATLSAGYIEYARAEGDALLRVYQFREIVYMFGARTTESWYNSGTGVPPFKRIQNGTMSIGIAGKNAVGRSTNHIYWLGDDSQLYRASAYDPLPLMPPAVHEKFTSYTLDTAKVRAIEFKGQTFVLIITGSNTWLYSETTQLWTELAYGANEAAYIGADYAFCYGKHLIISRINGHVYELDNDTYTDAGEVIAREIITAPLNANNLGKNGGRLMLKRIEYITESGVGNTNSVNPKAMCSYSVDYGQSFSNEDWVPLGRDGQNNIRVEHYAMASFRNLQLKIRVTEPVFFTLASIALDVKTGGHF